MFEWCLCMQIEVNKCKNAIYDFVGKLTEKRMAVHTLSQCVLSESETGCNVHEKGMSELPSVII